MARGWYIVHTYTGYEAKIERTIRSLIDTKELDENVVLDVRVPTQQIERTLKSGKKTYRNERFLPGYIMLELDLPDINWKPTCSSIRHIEGVTGFVGTNPSDKPHPISIDEAKNLLQRSGVIKGEKAQNLHISYNIGDKVKISEGPFATFDGTVEEVRNEQEKIRVSVKIFGRATPVELSFNQVEKI